MTEDAEYVVPEEVSKTAARLGLVGTVAEAVALSVPFDHAGGNRRFEQFVFKVDDLNVTGVVRLKPGEEAGQRPQRRVREGGYRWSSCGASGAAPFSPTPRAFSASRNRISI